MIAVELSKIIIDEKNHDQAIVLKQKGAMRQMPIAIGFVEATSIQMSIAGALPPRPLTHDLLAATIKALEAEVEYVLIDDLVEGTFFAKLCLKNREGGIILVDARPSDAVALSVRLNIPIFVEEKVLDQAVSSDM